MELNEIILMRQVRNPDPRVRTCASQVLLDECMNGNCLSLINYRTITEVFKLKSYKIIYF